MIIHLTVQRLNQAWIGVDIKQKNKTRKQNMTKLSEMAKAYQPQTTHNISELQQFSVDIDCTVEEYTDQEGKTFKINIAMVNGEKFRVPNSVLEGLKGIMQRLPNTKMVTVLKSGQGMNTRYQVIPSENKV